MEIVRVRAVRGCVILSVDDYTGLYVYSNDMFGVKEGELALMSTVLLELASSGLRSS